jgi:hypothetical protein
MADDDASFAVFSEVASTTHGTCMNTGHLYGA